MHPSHGDDPVVTIPAVTSNAHLVRIQAQVHDRAPGLGMIGLPDDTAECTRDRVRAAIVNSGFTWPDTPITVSVVPAELVADSGLDLAIALAVLATTDQLPDHLVTDTVYVGELGLDGWLRPALELPARLTAAVRGGYRQAVLPAGYLREVDAVRAVTVRGAYTLRDVVDGLRGDLTANRHGTGEVDRLR